MEAKTRLRWENQKEDRTDVAAFGLALPLSLALWAVILAALLVASRLFG